MKKLLAMLLLGAALVFGGCSTGTQKTTNIWTDDVERQDDGAIILSGNVDEDTFKEFRALTLDGKDHYTIILMTNGGCGYNTVAIMNRIDTMQKAGVKFTMYITGHGFSAGSYIFMMGDERIMNRGSHLMWHTITGQIEADGKMYQLDKYPSRKAMLIGMDQYVVGMFEKRFPHVTKEWVHSTFWNSGRTFQSAQSALLMGIATKIVN